MFELNVILVDYIISLILVIILNFTFNNGRSKFKEINLRPEFSPQITNYKKYTKTTFSIQKPSELKKQL